MRKNSSHGTVDQMIDAFESKILELSGTDVTSSTQVTAGTKYKRISHYNEFDNGHVMHNWSEMSDEEAEQLACQKSIEDPKDIYYVEYDDIMNPRSDTSWWNGQAYDSTQIAYRAGKPTLLSDEVVTSASNVSSDTHVSVDPGDEEIVYTDPNGMFGNPGDVVSLEEMKDYWNSNCTSDPSLAQYDSFESWFADTRQWLPSDVDASNSTDGLLPIDSAEDLNNVYMIMSYDAAGPETGMEGDSFEFICKLRAKDLDDAIAQVADYNNIHMTNYYAEYYISELDDGSEVLDSLDELDSLSDVDAGNCTDCLLPIDSGTDVILGKAVPNQTLEYAKEYLDTLSEAIQSEIGSEVDSIVFDSTDREFIVTVSYFGNIREYVVPFGDIVFDYDNMDGDVAYITNTIYQDLDTLGEDEGIYSSIDYISPSGPTYRLKHGYEPGTLPKDVNVLDHTEDGRYDLVELDRELTSKELDEYDIEPIKYCNNYSDPAESCVWVE